MRAFIGPGEDVSMCGMEEQWPCTDDSRVPGATLLQIPIADLFLCYNVCVCVPEMLISSLTAILLSFALNCSV